MRMIVIESPYAADLKKMPKFDHDDGVSENKYLEERWKAEQVEANLSYLRACMHDALAHRKEAAFASHGLYTQDGVLDDDVPEERELGIQAGFAFRQVVDESVFYVDRGMSGGMKYGLSDALAKGRPVQYRAFLGPYGHKEKAYDINVSSSGDKVHVDVPSLPGGMVYRDTLEDCIQALTEIVCGGG